MSEKALLPLLRLPVPLLQQARLLGPCLVRSDVGYP